MDFNLNILSIDWCSCLIDINECEDQEKYPCHGSCKNTPGNYTCSCPLGMQGDGKTSCQGFRITTIVAGEVYNLFPNFYVCGMYWIKSFNMGVLGSTLPFYIFEYDLCFEF